MRRKLFLTLLASWFLTGSLGLSRLAQAQTTVSVADARDFWKDFDDHTLRGVGKHVRGTYGEDRSPKFVDDMNAVIEALGGCLDLEIKEAHGKTPTDEEKKQQDARVKKIIDNGALARLSKLQLDIMKDHFQDSAGNVDFAKLQLAFEMFANGETRMGDKAVGSREMDQMNQWFVWKCFARIAIDHNVDKSSWEKLIHSLEKSKEIYRRVYPPKKGAKDAGARGELANPEGTESKASRFDKTKQLTDEEKKKLREEIDKLSVKEVLEREKTELSTMTTVAMNPCPRQEEFVRLNPWPQGEELAVQVGVRVTDAQGAAVGNTRVALLTSEAGFEVPSGAFLDTRYMDSDGAGTFTTTLLVPATAMSLNLNALEEGCLAFATKSLALASRMPSAAKIPEEQRLPEGAIFASALVEPDTTVEVQQEGYAIVFTGEVVSAQRVKPGDRLEANHTSSILFDDGTGMLVQVARRGEVPISATTGSVALLAQDHPQPLPVFGGATTLYVGSDQPFDRPAMVIDGLNKLPDKTQAVLLNRNGEKVGQLCTFTGLQPQGTSGIVLRTLDRSGATLREGKVIGGGLDGTPRVSFDKPAYKTGEKGRLLIGNQENYQKVFEMTRFGGAAKLSNEPIRIIQLSDVRGLPPEAPFGTTSLNFQAGHPGEARVAVIMPRAVPPKPVADPGNSQSLQQAKQAFEDWLKLFQQ